MARERKPASAPQPKRKGESRAPKFRRKALGKYQIQKQIGSGGMGAVYLALDTDLNRTVALKILPREKAQDDVLVQRFKSEAQSAAQLKHENVVTVYEAGQIDGLLYIALEYVDGVDVQHLLSKRGKLPVKRTTEIVKQVARALEHAHQQNIVHRDIKPSNLMIRSDGIVKLTDLGLARSVDETINTSITRAGTTVGTVDYMAPEQARDSKAADIRSDIYSLGCTWYHMLTGSPPYPDGSLTNKLNAHANEPPPDPRKINASVPEGIVATIHRMLAKKPGDRYQSPTKLLKDLDNRNLSREAISVEALAALADDDDADTAGETATVAQKTRSKGARQPPGPRSLPPKDDRKKHAKSGEDDESSSSMSLTPLQNGLVALAAISFLVLLWWITTHYASVLESPGPPPDKNPFEEGRRKPPSTSKLAKNDDKPSPEEADGSVAAEEQMVLNAAMVRASDIVSTPLLRPGERDAVPDWAARLLSRNTADIAADFRTAANYTVRDQPTGRREFPDLDSAIAQLPNSGGLIQLDGPGPFVLSSQRIAFQGPVAIVGSPGDRATIVLKAAGDSPARAVIELSAAAWTFANVDLLVAADDLTGEEDQSLCRIVQGHLTVQNCSLTLVGAASARVNCFQLAGDNPSRVLLDRLFVRGDNLCALDLQQTATDLVAVNCLFACGAAPIVRMTRAGEQPDSSTHELADRSACELRFLSCTACGRRTAFELHGGPTPGVPPATRLTLLNSLFGAEAGSARPELIVLNNWPFAPRPQSTDDAPQNLQTVIRSSLMSGWHVLVRRGARGATTVRNADAWRDFWDDPAEPAQFQYVAWPESAIVDFSRLSAAELDGTGMVVAGVRATDKGPFGGDVRRVRAPKTGRIVRALALTERWQAGEFASTSAVNRNVVEIDADRQDLGALISDTRWVDGTEFVVRGKGACESSPIRIGENRLRLRFAGFGNQPAQFTLSPKRGDEERGTEAFLSVEGGSLEIIGGRFDLSDQADASVPSWFLSVVDGDFKLRACHVRGLVNEASAFQGLIHWSRTVGRQASAGSGRPPASRNAELRDCYLAGSGTVLQTNVHDGDLSVHNCIFAGLNDLFYLDLDSFQTGTKAIVDVRRCTLSARGVCFRIRAADAIDSEPMPLRVFVTESVFASPIRWADDPSPTPVVLAFAGASREQQIAWWGSGNGFANEIQHFLIDEGNTAAQGAQSLESAWTAAWPPDRIARPLSGVKLAAGALHRDGLSPSAFALHDASPGQHWAGDGGPIGADLADRRTDATVVQQPPDPIPRSASHPPVPDPNESPPPKSPRRVVVPRF